MLSLYLKAFVLDQFLNTIHNKHVAIVVNVSNVPSVHPAFVIDRS